MRANPGWLRANPALYDVLAPPARVHGPAVADHMAAMLDQARRRLTDVAADRRAAEGFARRVQVGVVAMLLAPNRGWFVAHDLPGLLQVDAVRLVVEGGPVPPGTVARALQGRGAVLREGVADPVLHGPACGLARFQALAAVPLQAGPALLAIGCREALAGATADTLAFLGQVVGAALER